MAHWTHDTVIDAPRDVVFDILTDKANMSRIAPVRSRLERPGTTERQGVGAIHRLGVGPLRLREQVRVYDAPDRYEYTLISAAPVRNHKGTMTFDDSPGGTRVRYRIELDPVGPIPSGLVAFGIRFLLGRIFVGVRREAGRRVK